MAGMIAGLDGIHGVGLGAADGSAGLFLGSGRKRHPQHQREDQEMLASHGSPLLSVGRILRVAARQSQGGRLRLTRRPRVASIGLPGFSMATFALNARTPNPTVALIRLDPVSTTVLHDCFAQFGIATTALTHDIEAHLGREKYEACAIVLDDGAEPILARLRASPSNRRVLVYGIASNPREGARFGSFGINIVLKTPIDRQNVLRIIRSTHMLVMHELRQYVRIPIVVNVQMDANRQHVAVLTRDISAGGMAIHSETPLERGLPVSLTFDLPHAHNVALKGTVMWIAEQGHAAGVHFSEREPGRDAVTHWIDGYLGKG